MMARTFRRQPSPRHLALQRLRSLATSEPPRCIFATATLRPNDHPTDGEQWGGDEVTAVLRDLRERSGGASPDLVFVIANHMMGEGVLEKCVANIRDGLLDADDFPNTMEAREVGGRGGAIIDDFPNTMEALGEAREVEAREVGGRGGVIIGASTTGGVINEFANGGEHMEPEPLTVVMAGSLPKGSLLLPFSVSSADDGALPDLMTVAEDEQAATWMGFLGREGRDDAPGVVVLGARLANSEGFLRRLDTYVIKYIWVEYCICTLCCVLCTVYCVLFALHVPYTLVGEKKVFYYVLLL